MMTVLLPLFRFVLYITKFPVFFSFIRPTSSDLSKRIRIKYCEHAQFSDDEHFKVYFIASKMIYFHTGSTGFGVGSFVMSYFEKGLTL